MLLNILRNLFTNTMNKNPQILSPTDCTPEVILDPQGIIKITGRMIPVNADKFFKPIDEWLKEYFSNPAHTTRIEICIDYVNSIGTKYLFDTLHKIANIKPRKEIIVNWYYNEDDEDTLDKGTLFSANIDVPFNLIRT